MEKIIKAFHKRMASIEDKLGKTQALTASFKDAFDKNPDLTQYANSGLIEARLDEVLQRLDDVKLLIEYHGEEKLPETSP